MDPSDAASPAPAASAARQTFATRLGAILSMIGVSVGLVKRGQASAVVSMGNTGACVAAATLGLGTLEGVKRPGIAVTLALTGNPVTLLDMGANIAPKPQHLVEYGAMGSIYMRDCLRVEKPRIRPRENQSAGTSDA